MYFLEGPVATSGASPAKRVRSSAKRSLRLVDKENKGCPMSPVKTPVKLQLAERLPLSPRKDIMNSPNHSAQDGGPPCKMANLGASPVKSKALFLGSPARSPSIIPRTPEKRCPSVTKGRALKFDSVGENDVMSSPRKSIGTPRPVGIKPVASPLRLARQEGEIKCRFWQGSQKNLLWLASSFRNSLIGPSYTMMGSSYWVTNFIFSPSATENGIPGGQTQ